MRILKPLLTLITGLFLGYSLQAQITADFTSNTNSGCGSLQVSFTDLSASTAGSIVSWDWELGGVSSTSQNPGRIFGSPGVYTICLTVTDSNGDTATECKDNFITVYNFPTPAFSTNNQFGCAPTEVTFIDESVSIDGNITQWVWGLGGTAGVIIENGSSPEVSSTYENADDYTISLTVTDDNGCVNTITEEDYLTIFDFPNIDVSLSDTFNCSAPFAIDATLNSPEPNVNYIWNFGNGGPIFQGVNPPTTLYQTEGIYTITVIAENTLTSCRDTLILEDVINIGDIASFTYTPDEGCQGMSVSFDNTTNAVQTEVEWDFGDGTTSEEISPTHVYNTPGCYFVTLTTEVNGCTDIKMTTECIEVFSLPSANINIDNPNGCTLPHTVQFTGTSDTGLSYLWDLGDGTTSQNQNPTHTFLEYGIYPITLTVTNENGCTNTTTDTVRIFELEAQMDFNEISGCSPLSFTLAENSISVTPINSWYWEVSAPNAPTLSSTEAMPSFTIVDTGWYDVTLIVTNTLGCVDTITNNGAIGVGLIPQVDFIADPLLVCVDQGIQFTDLSSTYVDTWIWNFGDGNFSFEQNPVYDYAIPDTFDVSLSVSNNGCESILSIEDYITVLVPQANFEVSRNCINPYEISFTDISVGADSIAWDFGLDAIVDTSSILTPVVLYPDTGCYEMMQIAFNFTTACVDTLELEVCITDPLADFVLSPLTGCSPLVVNVTNNSVFDVAWDWIAPGAVISNNTVENPTITYNTPGIYADIQLVVTDVNGCQDTLMNLDTVFVDGVFVDFEALPPGGCDPLEVQFLDNSSSLLSPIASWSWDIANGAFTTTDQNTSFFFETTGTYPVSLTVTNEMGCVGTLDVANAVVVSRPIALFAADSISCPADTVAFADLSSGNNLSYLWNFGDGFSSTEMNPNHQFLNTGTFNVCLTIIDDSGCDQEYCQIIEIVNPIADFTQDTTYANCPPLVVNFENLSQNVSFFEWNFGDNSGVSDLESPPHAYTIPGTYSVQLVAGINANCTDTLLVDDLILLEGPIGGFLFNTDSICIPEEVTFIGNSNENYTYIWDFGDGTLDTTYNTSNDTITHTYLDLGTYVPKLTLVNAENCDRTLESPDSIYVGLLDIDFTATDSTLCEGIDETQFINLINSSAAITDFQWIFENGSPSTSTAFEPFVSFPNMGLYDVSLIVENAFCRDTLTKENFIGAGSLPNADFVSSGTGGCVPYGIQFTDQSSVASGSIVSWEWTFGGIGSTNELNPYYEYTTPGSFDVNLVVTTEFNCSDTATLPVVLYEAAQPLLSLSEPEICIGDIVQLGVAIQTDTTGLDYYWLDDPTLSCLNCFDPFANPEVPTTYYFVTNTPEGCSDTTEILVNVLPYSIPDISITADTTLCIDESIQLNVFSEGMVSYEWEQSADSLSCYVDCSNPIANPIISTSYTVTVTNAFGCDAVDSVLVDVVDQNQSFIGEDRTICEGDSVQLFLSVDGSPTWLVNDGLSCDDCDDPIAFPSQTTVYPIEMITTDFACLLLDTITVNVLSPSDIDAGDDVQICIGESITLDATTNSEGSILWTPATQLSSSTVLNPMASPTATTTYMLNVEEDLCVLTDSVEVTVQLVTDVQSFDQVICEGDTVELFYVGDADVIEWSPSNSLSDAFSENPLAFPLETTTYVLDATLSTCASDTATATVFVNKGPEVSVPSSYNKFPEVDVQVEVEAFGGSGDYTFDWPLYDGLSCNNCPDPLMSKDTSGFYSIIVRDEENGCATEELVFFNLMRTCNPDLITVPNIFTPNDDGYNDEIKVISGTVTEIFNFSIYNRWGALVFQTADINEGWDGLLKNEKAPSGVYVYYVVAPCSIDGSKILKKGDITLMR